MKTIILLGTLKTSGLSNTQTLSEFFASQIRQQGSECEIIKLVDYNILPGTYTKMAAGDDWPIILDKIIGSQIVIFATPIWWGNHSSQIQQVIERLDHIHDNILAGKNSVLEGKVGGILITGDSDGAQHIIGNICNFWSAIGIKIPPYCTLSVMSEKQAKGAQTTREELMEIYEKQYASTAQKMARQLLDNASLT
jgi:multimeric flavodoxin WrbA